MTLTINIDDQKLDALCRKAANEGNSLDEFFENYIDKVLEEENVQDQYGINNPVISSELQGKSPIEVIKELTKDIRIPKDVDERADYQEYIIRKHA